MSATGAGSDARPTSARRIDAWVPWLLLFGGIVGYLIGGAGPGPRAFIVAALAWLAGVAALGSSSTWSTRDKVLGTFVVPGGLLGAFALVGRPVTSAACTAHGGPGMPTIEQCTGGTSLPPTAGILVLAVLLVAPVVMAVHLERVRRRTLRSLPVVPSH